MNDEAVYRTAPATLGLLIVRRCAATMCSKIVALSVGISHTMHRVKTTLSATLTKKRYHHHVIKKGFFV